MLEGRDTEGEATAPEVNSNAPMEGGDGRTSPSKSFGVVRVEVPTPLAGLLPEAKWKSSPAGFTN